MAEVDIQGEVVKQQVQVRSARLPPSANVPERGTAPFVVVHHHDWEFVQDVGVAKGGEWLPAVTECRLNPGSNGVGVRGIGKDARLDPTGLMNGIRSKRSVEIRQHDPRLGEYADYATRYTLENGAFHYTYAWLKYKLINNGRNAVPQLDKARMYGFRRKLLEAGLVDPMPRLELESHLLRLNTREATARDQLDHGNLTSDAFDRLQRDLQQKREAMTAAWDRQFGGVSSEPEVVVSQGADVEDAIDPMAFDPESLPNPAERTTRRKRGEG